INAGVVMEDEPFVVDAANSIDDLRSWMAANSGKCNSRFLVVADRDENFAGYLPVETLYSGSEKADSPVGVALYDKAPFVTEDVPVNRVCEIMGDAGLDCIAVVSKPGNKVTGIINAADIIKTYSHLHLQDNAYQTSISIPRRTLKLIVRGRTLVQFIRDKTENN
ncbi:MAG TPA: CBS domain-containing protein, partial [Chitinophagaceae bacterium]|nr:CBS domain-containing protein [Chitinophagaceae bacterium]